MGLKRSTSLLFLIITLLACHKDKALAPGACTTISYSEEIVPIINSSCVSGLGPLVGCHDAWIHEYHNIDNYMNNGKWQFEVLHAKTMPEIPNDFGIDSLTAQELHIMKCWIDQGWPEN